MLRIVLVLLACCTPLAARAQPAPTAAEYVRQQSLATPLGELVAGLVLPRPETETLDSKAVLYVAQLRPDGKVRKSWQSEPFPFYTAGGRHYLEEIRITSPARFSIQLNQRGGACGGSYEIHRFALVAGAWRVSGRDVIEFLCGGPQEGVGDSRTEWSANFLAGTVIAREFRQDRLVSTQRQERTFPVLLLRNFDPADRRYGPR